MLSKQQQTWAKAADWVNTDIIMFFLFGHYFI